MSPPYLKPRLLLACTGWPSGIMEIGSWASHQGLAEVVVFQMQPASIGNTPWGVADGARGAADTAEAIRAVGEQFVLELTRWRPHVVGFRLEAGGLEDLRRFIQAVRLFSDAEVVLGGPTATSHPVEVLERTGADYVFTGEAEEPFNLFLRLARERESKDRQPDIPGLAYRYGGRTWLNTLPQDGYGRTAADDAPERSGHGRRQVRNAVRPAAPREVLAANRLDWSLLRNFQRPFDSLYFTGGRGCPGRCTFCAQSHGREIRVKTAEQLMEEIEAADARVAEGAIQVTRWDLFKHVDAPDLPQAPVAWAAIYDEDFFLDRGRAIEFFRLWQASPLRQRYRISVQTNPCSLLAGGRPHSGLFEWIDRVKPMIQVGAESFHPGLLARWRKRHDVTQLRTVLDALERTRQDYTTFSLLTDFDSTPEEVIETLRLLVLEALPRRRMRIASSPFTIPLYDSETRRQLEDRMLLGPERVRDFTDYERPQPEWMDPLAADLADRADAELRFALDLEHRDAALVEAMRAVCERLENALPDASRDGFGAGAEAERVERLRRQAKQALEEIREKLFRSVESSER